MSAGEVVDRVIGGEGGLEALDTFARRHIGPGEGDVAEMLKLLGMPSLEGLIAATVPADIRLKGKLQLPAARSESEALADLRTIARKNKIYKSFIGMGYYGTITPPVILRNILENPGWYTQYTPYQAEISQGRLEALLNFQTMVCDLTGLPLANSSMLDEATAAAEAMHMCHSLHEDRPRFFVAQDCHPQTIAVVKTRAKWLNIEITIGDPLQFCSAPNNKGAPDGNPGADASCAPYCGILVQYPTTDGRILDYGPLVTAAHKHNTQVVAATDLLALTLIKPPGEWGGGGADIAVGSAQRFGVPMGCGGPHAGFMACKAEFTRKLPGRIVGVSKDAAGNVAYRLALQTREQHIRREKATSNICTAQVLLAVMAGMYAAYHGPEGLRAIARRIQLFMHIFFENIQALNEDGKKQIYFISDPSESFDTSKIQITDPSRLKQIKAAAEAMHFSLRVYDNGVGISFDESTTLETVSKLLNVFGVESPDLNVPHFVGFHDRTILRTSSFLTHPVFNSYHAEHEMLRYMRRLEAKDLSLTTSMIPLGSCTMKLNGTSEMLPVTWEEFGGIHPFAPAEQVEGYAELFRDLEKWLAEITGFEAVSLQPNAGSQGEYAGLLAIRAYHEAGANERRKTKDEIPVRDVCLIPTSAHGTNPASAVVAGLKVVAVACDAAGNIDVGDLKKKAAEHAEKLACIMITYPSTHGVFEESVREICAIVHGHGGQVYMDGANMNAQVGLTSPGFIGADVCHLNLHKTFCIPHGGGGPGMGPIGVRAHLAGFLPAHPLDAKAQGLQSLGLVGPVSAAPYGSASILVIPWMYIRMMGEAGLTRATEVAILNANYMAKRLEAHYPILYRGRNGHCAHEFILDCRQFEETSGVKVEDIAKRLMDYGFHAPTMSWPVPGTLMFEPTESESRAELDRLCDAMIAIRGEIKAIEEGRMDRADNPLKHAPHTASAVTSDEWHHKYSRQMAAYPAAWTKVHKFWPAVGRIDNPWGDRNLVCSCPPV